MFKFCYSLKIEYLSRSMSLIAYSYINTCTCEQCCLKALSNEHKIIVTSHEADTSSKVYVQEKVVLEMTVMFKNLQADASLYQREVYIN